MVGRLFGPEYEHTFTSVGRKILVLNFANPVHPGGGVRRGARAQEEDLCRRSSLLPALESLVARPHSDYNNGLSGYMGSDAMILTPEVEVIKDEHYGLLDKPFTVAVLTCAAPMVSHGMGTLTRAQYEELFYHRIMMVFHIAIYYGYTHLVLGAWGCGAFGNDANLVSDLFYNAMKELKVPLQKNGTGTVKDFFRRIDFAVLDRTNDKYNYKAFLRNFENFYRDEDEKDIRGVLEYLKKRETHMDAIRGSLIGGAAGDALGYPVEFDKLSEIKAKYGDAGIQAYDLDPASGKALISDDTQMTLFTATGILNGHTRMQLRGVGGAPSFYVWLDYKAWLRTQQGIKKAPDYKTDTWLAKVPGMYARRAPGMTCLSAIAAGEPGTIENPINNSKGCGGVMRVAPLGLFYEIINGNVDDLDREGAAIAALTNGHPLGYIPAAVLTHILNRIVYSRERYHGLKEIVIEAKDAVAELFSDKKEMRRMAELIDRAVSLSENEDPDEDNIRILGEGWVAEETLTIAIYCALRHEDDFSAGIIAAVNHDGDSDSTGSVTGNILGAWLGYPAIDDIWKKDLELEDVILEVADDLCHGCQMEEFSAYYDPLWDAKYIKRNYHRDKEMR